MRSKSNENSWQSTITYSYLYQRNKAKAPHCNPTNSGRRTNNIFYNVIKQTQRAVSSPI